MSGFVIPFLFGVVIACLPGITGFADGADATHPFSIHDMLAMDRVGDPNVSPDGATVVFTLRKTDVDANKGLTDLWTVGIDGRGLNRLTTHKASDTHPRWSADGRWVYFLSGRGDHTQVWRIPLTGGEARPVTDLPLDVSGFALSPDGRRIAVGVDVFLDAPTPQATRDRLDQMEKDQATGKTYDRLFVRHWDQWDNGRRGHIFVMPIEDGGAPVPSAKAVDVMAGMDANAPTKPWGGFEEVAFTPDGKALVFTAMADAAHAAWSTNYDLYVTPLDGSKPPRSLTGANPAWDTSPAFSPDGKTLAYLAMKRPGFEADRFRIMLMDWPSGQTRVLAQDWDRSPRGLVWSQDGKTLYVTADNLGQTALFAIDTGTAKVRTVVPEGHVSSVHLAGGGRLLFSMDHFRSPAELYTVGAGGEDVRRVTHINDDHLRVARMGEPEHFQFTGAGGDPVWAWVVKPADFDPERKYPVAFLIHGGPQGSFGNMFHYRWNPQAYAGAGYAAVMIDFHGSTGYGQAFTDSISGDWGGAPLEDLRKGLAAALERYPWMDGDRVGALGASYGGYMVNWIAGNWSDRFRCLVNHDGVFNTRMMYYATEELWFPEWESGGTPWASPEGYEKFNPVNYIQNWKTPMLVVHGALDYRVPDTQGLGAFTALQRRGIPSRLLYFPDENHWVLQPHNSILWHDTVIGWLDRWLKSEGS